LKNLDDAKIGIGESVGKIITASLVYETEPWGFKSETEFLNQVVLVETNLSPSGLLGRVLMIESQLGRLRDEKQYTSRKIDIDILLYNNSIIKDVSLVIPHPLMHERRFVLTPLCEIAPDLIHPALKKSIKYLLKKCPDKCKVVLYKPVRGS
jgi:2-amino-4-hydroxy-6-hydroxymethyldihydropteridine diphosphokinase